MINVLIIKHTDNDGELGGSICDKHVTMQFGRNNKIKKSTLALSHVGDDYEKINNICMNDGCIYEIVYIVDYSFNVEEANKIFELLVSKSKTILWFDHHDSSFDFINENPDFIDKYENHIYGLLNKSVCGAFLAYIELVINWRYSLRTKLIVNEYSDLSEKYDNIPRIVKLVDDWDTWKHKIPNGEAKYFNEGSLNILKELLTEKSDYYMWNLWLTETYNSELNNEFTIDEVIDNGRTSLIPKEKDFIHKLDSIGFIGELNGVCGLFVNEAGGNSLYFGNYINEFDFCCKFLFNGTMWKYTLFSTEIDVYKICKAYGGGGHKHAAGFPSKNMEIKFIKSLSSHKNRKK